MGCYTLGRLWSRHDEQEELMLETWEKLWMSLFCESTNVPSHHIEENPGHLYKIVQTCPDERSDLIRLHLLSHPPFFCGGFLLFYLIMFWCSHFSTNQDNRKTAFVKTTLHRCLRWLAKKHFLHCKPSGSSTKHNEFCTFFIRYTVLISSYFLLARKGTKYFFSKLVNLLLLSTKLWQQTSIVPKKRAGDIGKKCTKLVPHITEFLFWHLSRSL